jgi:autotransporter-associated beta strand protein
VPNTNVRQIFLRSEVGGVTSFSATSVIGNAVSHGDKAPVSKIGGGRVEIHGNNTYTGNSAARTGELVLGNPNALGSATSPVSLGEATPVLADVRVATVLSSYAGSLGTFSAGGTYTGAPSAIDGVTLMAGDRVLVKDRGTQNGIYVVLTVSPNVWGRAADMDSSAEIAYGQRVKVTSGTLNGGIVYFQAQRGTGAFPGTLVLNSSPLDWHKDIINPDVSILNNGVNISRNFDVVDNGSSGKSILGGSNTSGVSTYSGSVTLARGLHVTAASGGSVEFSGDITGAFGVTKVGAGKVVFPNSKSYTGPTVISTGTLQVDGTLATSGLTVAAGATLQGVGAIANGVAVSGTLAPGNGVGTITVNTASFSGGGMLAVEINGATCDRLLATGALNLSGCTLAIIPTGAVLSGESYVIAEGAPLTGAFAGIPSGYSVSYAGNKATLKAISAYFVSPSGSDTLNDGLTVDTPFATIQKAANLMVAGNTCYIRAGIYREMVIVPRSGTSSLPITFTAYNNETVTSWLPKNPRVLKLPSAAVTPDALVHQSRVVRSSHALPFGLRVQSLCQRAASGRQCLPSQNPHVMMAVTDG